MKVIIVESEDAVADKASQHCLEHLQRKPNLVMGLATGSTPIELYKRLIEAYQQGTISFADVTSFNLDEYIGLVPEHHQSYRHFMHKQLFEHIDIQPDRTHLPDGMAEPESAALAYEAAILAAGGIDLQILGLGSNGHIGFNEPFSSLGSKTRIKTLTQQTIQDNQRFFADDEFQPHLAITMGIGTIMRSRDILLLATGERKAAAIKAMVEGPVAANCPASALQFHPNVSVMVDSAAASQLEHQQYYQWVQAEAERLESD